MHDILTIEIFGMQEETLKEEGSCEELMQAQHTTFRAGLSGGTRLCKEWPLLLE
jgi:hypothetical protein